jgi:hypothetical protein
MYSSGPSQDDCVKDSKLGIIHMYTPGKEVYNEFSSGQFQLYQAQLGNDFSFSLTHYSRGHNLIKFSILYLVSGKSSACEMHDDLHWARPLIKRANDHELLN